jgi:hypothetical protein
MNWVPVCDGQPLRRWQRTDGLLIVGASAAYPEVGYFVNAISGDLAVESG